MSSDPIEVLRELAAKWRGRANDAMRRSGTWHGNHVADRIEFMADELESALASLSAPPAAGGVPDCQYADAEALIGHLDSLCDDSDEKWQPAQAAIAGILAWQETGSPVYPPAAGAVPEGFIAKVQAAHRAEHSVAREILLAEAVSMLAAAKKESRNG